MLLAAKPFERPQTEVLGWQLLFEAFTGCRTSEILDLRMVAKDNSTPGFIEGDWLWLKRRENGTNPFALIHPAPREAVHAHREWHSRRFPNHPMWIPHRFNRAKSADVGGLTQVPRLISPTSASPCAPPTGRGETRGHPAAEPGHSRGGSNRQGILVCSKHIEPRLNP